LFGFVFSPEIATLLAALISSSKRFGLLCFIGLTPTCQPVMTSQQMLMNGFVDTQPYKPYQQRSQGTYHKSKAYHFVEMARCSDEACPAAM